MEPLRFLHAAGLWLDRPPAGTGLVPEDLRRIAEDATLTAFDRLIDVAIERQVDFVLLAGDCFDAGDASLRAQVALVEGCGRLAEQHIRVFVLPGRADPPLAWRMAGDLPENVTCLVGRDDEPVAVVRDGHIVATVARAEPARHANIPADAHVARGETSRRHPFAVGLLYVDAPEESGDLRSAAVARSGDRPQPGDRPLPEAMDLPFDYLALGGPGKRRTFHTSRGLAHHPGPLQGLNRQHVGQHGFAVVEIDASGLVHKKFVAAAPLRWERFELQIDPATTIDALLNGMRRELSAGRPEPGEQLRLVEWSIRGAGPLARSLEAEAFCDELWSALASAAIGAGVPVRHALRLLPGSDSIHDFDVSQAGKPDLRDSDSPLDFAQFHAELPALTADDLSHALQLDTADSAWQSRLRLLAPHLDARAVEDDAARLGACLFSGA